MAGSQYQPSTITAQIDAPVICRLARRTIPHSAGSSAVKARRRALGAVANKAKAESKRAGTKIQYAGPGLAEVRSVGSCTLMWAPLQHIEFLEKQKLPLVTNAPILVAEPGGCPGLNCRLPAATLKIPILIDERDRDFQRGIRFRETYL